MENKLTPPQVAKELNLSMQTILKYIKSKFIKSEKVYESPLKYHYEVDIEEVEKFKNEMENKRKNK